MRGYPTFDQVRPKYRFLTPKCVHRWMFEKTSTGTRRTCQNCGTAITDVGRVMSPAVKGKDSMTAFNRGMS
jgi:hypothetical protein